jgi:hypothetical protein
MDAEKLARTFVELADSLVQGFDAPDVLHLLVESSLNLLDVAAAGVLLADDQDRLHVAASSSEGSRLLDLYQLQNEEGPCLECYHTGQTTSVRALVAEEGLWPQFAAAAVDEGFDSVVALPLRLRRRVIGAMNLFGKGGSALDPDAIPIAQAMADVCTIGILQDRRVRGREVLIEQLQRTLNIRITIEQAKGALAARFNVGVAEALELLRRRARDTRRPLAELAEELVSSGHSADWAAAVRRYRSSSPSR